jgi:hypothetical protein
VVRADSTPCGAGTWTESSVSTDGADMLSCP